MAALDITASQQVVIDATDQYVEDAFLEGVSQGASLVIPGLKDYDKVKTADRPLVRRSFRSAMAALLKAMGWGSGLTTTVTLAKITGGGTDGSLTFTNGILTAKVDPT